MFKITYPWRCRSTLAGLPDGVGEGAHGLPLYGLIEHDRWSFYAASPCAWRLL